MDESRFWELIERSRKLPGENRDQSLAAVLRELAPDEILEFDKRFTDCSIRAYRWNLWAVANWIHGFCSDDSFTDFRARLIGLGREIYMNALESPDSLTALVDHPEGEYTIVEGFQYVAREVYEEKTGAEMPDYDYDYPDLPDKNFDLDDVAAMRARFPRLLARLPTCGGVDPSFRPERRTAWLGEWDDECVHAAFLEVTGFSLRGPQAMDATTVRVPIGEHTVEIDYTPLMGIFAKGPPAAVDALEATLITCKAK